MKVFGVFQTQAEVARKLNVSGEAVRKWINTAIPPERVICIAKISGWKVTPHELRPDIYPNPSDAMPFLAPPPADKEAA
jgi:DNA-binding transcriptional regulator YdaS (Cro superfamily)